MSDQNPYAVALTEEEHGGAEDTADVLFDASQVREITATNLIDEDSSAWGRRQELQKGATDLGEGFLMQEEPVLIQRDADGAITKLTPLSEIPGVHFDGQVLTQDPDRLTSQQKEAQAMVAEAKETPVPLSTSDREKLRHILATRLFKHYATEASLRNRARWNPFRDGIPELPAGAPKFLSPSKEMPLVPATEGQVYQYLLKHVAKRAEIVDTKRGLGGIQDLALRIR